MSEQHASTHQSLADEIASLSIKTYQALPAKCRPVLRSNGVPEWTILASIVLAIPRSSEPDQLADRHTNSGSPPDHSSRDAYDLRVVSLGTGMKCLPCNRLPPAGDTLHDQHAEVLARRGFRRWLLDQAMMLSDDFKKGRGPSSGRVLEVTAEGVIRLLPRVKVWMYVSTLPCGDASTTYTAAYQPIAMANLKSRPLPVSSSCGPDQCGASLMPVSAAAGSPLNAQTANESATTQASSTARGRNDYTLTSSLRTKPGRPDSFPSISMSCSDKICAWSVLGLQGALLSNARIPTWAHGGSSRYEEYGMAPGEEPRIGAGVDSSGQWHFAPVYLDGIVVGDVLPPAPETEGDLVGWHPDTETSGVKRDEVQVWSEKVRTFRQAVRKDAEWALSGRVAGIANSLSWPFRHVTPHMEFTDVPFPYSKLTLSNPSPPPPPSSSSPALPTPSQPGRDAAPMINSLLHIPSTSTSPPITEILYQGADARQPWKPPGLIPLPGKRRSRACKLEMMRDVLRLAGVGVEEETGAMKGKKTEPVRGGCENGMGIADNLAVTSTVQQMQEDVENVSLHAKQVAEVSGGLPRTAITYRHLKHSVFSVATLSASPIPSETAISDSVLPSSNLSAAHSSAKSTTPATEETPPGPSVSPYQLAKRTLRGIPALPALVAGFERCGPLHITSGSSSTSVGVPFAGWLGTGSQYESFDHTGRAADLPAESYR